MGSRLDLAFEHQILKSLKDHRPLPSKWLLAVSGGIDSMVLAEFCLRWRRYLKIELAIAHVHHGRDTTNSQLRYRARVQALVKKYAADNKLKFVTNKPKKTGLNSEAELRYYRESLLSSWLKELDFDGVVYAHHSGDLLETRLIRLIRGTGPQGLMAMTVNDEDKIRPLLVVSREQIKAYATSLKLNWCEDPTNSKTKSLRNWIRGEWLPSLERHQAGACNSLARSLDLLAKDVHRKKLVTQSGLERKQMKNASSVEQEALIAAYLHQLGLKNYTSRHIKEIAKRIDTRQKHLKFQMLGVNFELSPDFLRASRV